MGSGKIQGGSRLTSGSSEPVRSEIRANPESVDARFAVNIQTIVKENEYPELRGRSPAITESESNESGRCASQCTLQLQCQYEVFVERRPLEGSFNHAL